MALDSFYVGKLKGVGSVWQLTAVDTATRWAICRLFVGDKTAQVAADFVDRSGGVTPARSTEVPCQPYVDRTRPNEPVLAGPRRTQAE